MSSTHTTIQASGEILEVEMGEIKVSSRLTDTLAGYGLGACVGVCVYDPVLKIAGLAHVVLPERQNIRQGSGKDRPEASSGKFADTAIPFLIESMCRYGAKASHLRAAVVGGAHIFSQPSAVGGQVSRLEIGQRNVNAVTHALEAKQIPIVASDVGGCHGRTVALRLSDGAVTIRPIGSTDFVLVVLGHERETTAKAKWGNLDEEKIGSRYS